jgi:hypothetical protein
MVELRIESLYRAAWAVFQCQHAQIVVDRDRFRTRLQRRLGQEVASDIQLHVDISLGQRLNVFPDVPNPKIMLMREYYELLGLETALQEIERRIDANAIFHDPGSLLPTLGLSWQQDVLRLLDGQVSPGYMPPKNVKKFLGMVSHAEQRVPAEDGIEAEEMAAYFHKWRRELIEFLERAVKVGEPVWCRLGRADPHHSRQN